MDAGDDWRANIHAEARGRVVNKIMETLRKHLPPVPVLEAEVLVELQRIAARFEDRVYAAATSQSDYLRTISLKMLSMERKAPGDDWRAYLHAEARSRIVNKIMEILRKHLPVSVPEAEGLVELQRIAARFEDKAYAAATNLSDYYRTISIKVLSMESKAKTQQNPAPGSSSKGKKQNKLRCQFCKKGVHFKKDCLKRKIWFDKKGVSYDPTHKPTKAHENNEDTVLKESGLAE